MSPQSPADTSPFKGRLGGDARAPISGSPPPLIAAPWPCADIRSQPLKIHIIIPQRVHFRRRPAQNLRRAPLMFFRAAPRCLDR